MYSTNCINRKIPYILLTVCVYVFHLMLRIKTDFALHISRLVLIMENPCVSCAIKSHSFCMAYIKLVLTVTVYYLNQQYATFLYKDPSLWQLVVGRLDLS